MRVCVCHCSNGLRAKRDRTYSGRSCNSDQQAVDAGSMESLFTDIQLNENVQRSSSPEEYSVTTSGCSSAGPSASSANTAR